MSTKEKLAQYQQELTQLTQAEGNLRSELDRVIAQRMRCEGGIIALNEIANLEAAAEPVAAEAKKGAKK